MKTNNIKKVIIILLIFFTKISKAQKGEYIIANNGNQMINIDTIVSGNKDIGSVINNAISSKYKVIKILPGEYTVSTKIKIDVPNVQIIGIGKPYLIQKIIDPTCHYVIDITSHSCILKNFKIDPIHLKGAIRLLGKNNNSNNYYGISFCLFENLTIGKQNFNSTRNSKTIGITLESKDKQIEFNTFKNINLVNNAGVKSKGILLNAGNSYIGNNSFENIIIERWQIGIEFMKLNNNQEHRYFDNYFSNFKIQTSKNSEYVIQNIQGDNNTFRNFYLNDWRNKNTNREKAKYVVSINDNANSTIIDNFEIEKNPSAGTNDEYKGYYLDKGKGTIFTNNKLNSGSDFIYNSVSDYLLRGKNINNEKQGKYTLKNFKHIEFNKFDIASFLGKKTLFAPKMYSENDIIKHKKKYLKSLVTIENNTIQPSIQINNSTRTKINIPNLKDSVDLIVGNHYCLSSKSSEKVSVYGSVYSTLGDYVLAPIVKNKEIFDKKIENIKIGEIYSFLKNFKPITYKNEKVNNLEFRNNKYKNISLTAPTNVSWLEGTNSSFSNVVKRSKRKIGRQVATFINYDMITSLLVGAVNDLKSKNEELKSENEKLKNRLNIIEVKLDRLIQSKSSKVLQKQNENNDSNLGLLYQNIPNVFEYKTNIKYYVKKNHLKAKIVFVNQNGEIIKIRNIKYGKGNIDFYRNGLNSGIYYYSLILDNSIIDTKKMIIN